MSDDIIQGTTYGQDVKITSAEAESLIVREDAGIDQPTTPVSDPQTTAATERTTGEDATAQQVEPPQEQPTDVETAPSEGQDEGVEINEVVINGERYEMEQLESFIEDSKNKSEWQRKNTQRSQELAEEKKSLDAELDKWKALKKDDELMDVIKDYVDQDHPLFKEEQPIKSEEPEVTESRITEPSDQKVSELENRLMQVEAERKVEQDVAALAAKHPELKDNPEAIDQVLTTAVEKGLVDLDTAYAVTAYQSAEDSAFKKALKQVEKANELRNIPEAEGSSRAQRVVSTKKPMNYEEARELAFKEYQIYE